VIDPFNLTFQMVSDVSDVTEFWAWLTRPGRTRVGVDTEGTGLQQWRPDFRVRTLQFGDTDGGWSVPWDDWRGLALEALKWCDRAGVKQVWWNLPYDYWAIWEMGYRMPIEHLEDGMIWAGLDNWSDDTRRLKPLAVREFGPWAGSGEERLKAGMAQNGWTWATVPLDWRPYVGYGVLDTCLTAALWDTYEARRRNVKWQGCHSTEVATASICTAMARNGLPVNGLYLANQADLLVEREKMIAARLQSEYSITPSAPASVAKALQLAGVMPPGARKTAGGQLSVDKDALGAIDHPIADLVLEYRDVHRTRVNYLAAMSEASGYQLDETARIHPQINPCQARTTRMSVADPPLQQLPAGDLTVRKAVEARDGHVIVSADYGQIELRTWAFLNFDDALKETLRLADEQGEDFFVMLGRDLYKEPNFQKSDKRRQILKSTMYATLYSGGVETIAATARVDVYQAVKVLKALQARYRSVASAGSGMINKLNPEGFYVTTPTGRRFKLKRRQEIRKLPNWATQGHAAEILKMALIGLQQAGLEQWMILPVHDEVLFEMPAWAVVEAVDTIREVMNAVVDKEEYGVSITATPVIGRTWADCK